MEGVCHRGVCIILIIVGVGADGILVFGIIGVISQIFVGIFEVEAHAMDGSEWKIVRGLDEHIGVPLSADIDILVGEASHDATGAPTARQVEVGVGGEAPFEEGGFGAIVADVGIGTASGGVFIFGVIAEGIIALRVEKLAIQKTAPTAAAELGIDAGPPSIE